YGDAVEPGRPVEGFPNVLPGGSTRTDDDPSEDRPQPLGPPFVDVGQRAVQLLAPAFRLSHAAQLGVREVGLDGSTCSSHMVSVETQHLILDYQESAAQPCSSSPLFAFRRLPRPGPPAWFLVGLAEVGIQVRRPNAVHGPGG